MPQFSIQLPEVKLEYPSSEYWAEVRQPSGKQSWAFAVYTGQSNWIVPIEPEQSGAYQLLRVEKRQGDGKQAIRLGEGSQVMLEARTQKTKRRRTPMQLVEAGAFAEFYAAPEPWCINDHTLVQGPDRSWHLFGITHPKPLDFFKDPGRRLAHATGPTLLSRPWQGQAPAVTADWEKYREYFFWAPHVIHDRGVYYMFVCAGDKQSHQYPLHLLTSPDLRSWERHPGGPLLVDGFDGRDPMVLRLRDRWALYYTATSTPEGGNHTVACATSKDLIHWASRRVVFTHPRAGTFGGPTESPFVVQRGSSYYLFVCDNDWTDVYLSMNPFHWEYCSQVGRIHSHASEIIRNFDGRWYITHAGWMSGPVAMAPLVWHDGLDRRSASVPIAKQP